jgi:hypothetical protein
VRAELPNPRRGLSHHLTNVKLLGLESALRTPLDKNGTYLPAVLNAINGPVKVNCDCGRWRFWYRYKASVGGYAITEERGFPKVRNRRLTGSVCKHLVVTLNYLQQSKNLHTHLAARFSKLADAISLPKREDFTSQRDQKKLAKGRVDRQLRAVSKAKETFKRERKKKQREDERLRRIAQRAERAEKRRKRDKEREAKQKEEFARLQASERALKRQLSKAKQDQDKFERDTIISLVQTLRSAGISDDVIKQNPMIKQSKVKIEEIT